MEVKIAQNVNATLFYDSYLLQKQQKIYQLNQNQCFCHFQGLQLHFQSFSLPPIKILRYRISWLNTANQFDQETSQSYMILGFRIFLGFLKRQISNS